MLPFPLPSATVAMLLADARLPSGGHAHSAGLEPALLGGLAAADVPAALTARARTTSLVEAGTAVVARHLALAAFYQGKRDFFREAMAGSRFELLPSGGTYFQLARYGAISDLGDAAFCEHLTRNVGVAAIPVSAFFADGRDERVIRFCFAKNESTLAAACERLCKL